jgi:hypothetical protein
VAYLGFDKGGERKYLKKIFASFLQAHVKLGLQKIVDGSKGRTSSIGPALNKPVVPTNKIK